MGTQLAGLFRNALAALLRYLPGETVAGWVVPDALRQVLLSGTSVTVPFIVTVVVLGVVLDFVANVLAPFVELLALLGFTRGLDPVVAQLVTVALLFGVVVLAGLFAEAGSGTGIGRRVGRAVEAIPGVGSVYNSFDRMSEVMLENDSQSFREVKLIEFPHADLYSLAFKTAEVEGASVPDSDREGMVVLFVPLAPNPVMGGFMVCVSEDRVRDVDMTVQEAFQAIVTSGVAMAESSSA